VLKFHQDSIDGCKNIVKRIKSKKSHFSLSARKKFKKNFFFALKLK
jgi:hypothetical protein